jgi:23S rRNA (uracil1939-C5)-methyltransferase
MVLKPLEKSGIKDYKLHPTITIPAGKRRRANLEAIRRGDDFYFGFHKYQAHRIQNIDHCIAMEPLLSELLKPLREVVFNVLDHREKAQIFLTEADNGIDLFLEIQDRKELEEDKRKLLEDFAKKQDVTRMTFRYRKVLDVIHEKAVPYIAFDNIKVEVDAYCFLQASKESDKILSDMVLKYAQGAKGADLFCGRGTYTLPLSKANSMTGYESDKNALMALGRALENSDRDIALHRRDLFTSPLQKSELEKFDFFVINPPRAGAEEQVKELAKLKSGKICYISCNPETFARDAKILIDSGFTLKEITPIDQFYWAPHMEVVGFFDKG